MTLGNKVEDPDPKDDRAAPGVLLFSAVVVVSIAIIALLLATNAAREARLALLAAALSSLGLGLVRLADGFQKPPDQPSRRRNTDYPKFWLLCFAIAFAGLIAAETLQRIPAELETPWLHAAQVRQPSDPRCAALANRHATDPQLIVAVRAGCR
jgi:hypothetical protein